MLYARWLTRQPARNRLGPGKVGLPIAKHGHFIVSRARNQDRVLRWTEAGGPPVKPPTREGFGTGMLEGMIRGHEGGDVHLDWQAGGLSFDIILPA